MRKDKVVSEVLGREIAITPSDLYHVEFKRSNFGGYDKAEVDAYLERVADVIEDLINQTRELKETNEALETEIKEFRAMERSLREAMVSSQRVSDDMVDAARREAKSLIEEARLKNLQAQIEAAKIPEALSRDINLLKQQRMRMRVEMMSILETHRQLLDTLIPLGAPLADVERPEPADIAKRPSNERAPTLGANAEARLVQSVTAPAANFEDDDESNLDDALDLTDANAVSDDSEN